MTLLVSVFIALAGGGLIGSVVTCLWLGSVVETLRESSRLQGLRGDAWRDSYFALLRAARTAGYSRDGQPYSWSSVDSLIGGTTVDTEER